MSETLRIPRHFHVRYSLLGRAIRRRLEDDERAEGVYILCVAFLLIGLVLLFYLAWALYEPALVTGSGAKLFAGTQLATGGLVFLTCFLGHKPALRITLSPDAVALEHGKRSVCLPRHSIHTVTTVTALEFHRHYRKYSQTRVFINNLKAPLVLLKTEEGPVVLELPEPHEASLRLLSKPTSEPIESEPRVVAA